MKINKVKFVWEKIDKEISRFGGINKIEITFSRDCENPIVYIDAGIVIVEDKSLQIDNVEILQKIGKINFEEKRGYREVGEFFQNSWKLIVDDKTYEGVFEEASFVSELKKIIRFDIILDYANKKIARYLK